MEGADLLRAVFARYEDHQGLEDLCTDDMRVIGDPPVGSFHPREGATTAERLDYLHRGNVSFRLREVEPVGPDTLIFSAVWRHEAGPRSGSAGLYWGAARLRDGKLARLAYCASREEAQRALGSLGAEDG